TTLDGEVDEIVRCGSGKEVTLPSPPPLRTARAPFNACSSSIGQRTCYGTRLPTLAWWTTCTVLRRGSQPGPGASAHATVGGRTSKGLAPRQQLLCPPKEFTGGSRTPTPEGSLPPCGWGKYPYPPDYRAAFASSLLLYPLPHRYPLRGAYRQGRQRAYHVPQVCPRGLGPA